ncbi:MAG: T9SS type A sorting domain-containing protein [Saprospiraceae bacterium]
MIKFYKVFYTIFSLIVLCCGLQSQNTFVKIIDVESRPQYAIQLLNWNERYFIYQFNSCLTHVCDGISEIYNSGEIIKSIEIPQFSGNLNTLHIHPIDNELILTGESLIPREDNKFLIYKVSPDDFSIIDSIKIFDSSYPHVFKFQKGSGFYNNQFIISGSGRDAENSPAKRLIYFLNPDYTIDTLLTFQFTRGNTNIWEQYVDHDGLLTFHFWYDNFDEYEFRSRIIKINEDKKVVWDWVSPPIKKSIFPYGTQHSDGFTLVCLPEWNHQSNVNLVAVNKDGTTRWSHFYPDPKIYKKREARRVKELKNGDILVMGLYEDRELTPRVYQSPYMCRISKEGKLLWERAYYTDYGGSQVSTGYIYDMVEHDDGRIMAVGQIKEGNLPPYTDILILTTDSDGCITPGCGVLNKLNDLISETEEVAEEKVGVKVSPNPFHNSLLISSKKSDNKIVKLKVYNAAGVLLQEHQIQSSEININTESWPSGLYFLEYLMENTYKGFTKVMRL